METPPLLFLGSQFEKPSYKRQSYRSRQIWLSPGLYFGASSLFYVGNENPSIGTQPRIHAERLLNSDSAPYTCERAVIVIYLNIDRISHLGRPGCTCLLLRAMYTLHQPIKIMDHQ